MASRYLGVDLGSKRIGLALGESAGGVVSPLKVIEARAEVKANAQAILRMAGDYEVGGIVIGLPLNMDGSEGPAAKPARSLAQAIRKLAGSTAPGSTAKAALRVYLFDERLTSHAADQLLAGGELTRKKKKARQDAVAAQIMLASFLEKRGGTP